MTKTTSYPSYVMNHQWAFIRSNAYWYLSKRWHLTKVGRLNDVKACALVGVGGGGEHLSIFVYVWSDEYSRETTLKRRSIDWTRQVKGEVADCDTHPHTRRSILTRGNSSRNSRPTSTWPTWAPTDLPTRDRTSNIRHPPTYPHRMADTPTSRAQSNGSGLNPWV